MNISVTSPKTPQALPTQNPETKVPQLQQHVDKTLAAQADEMSLSKTASEKSDIHPALEIGLSSFVGAASGFGVSAHGLVGAGIGARIHKSHAGLLVGFAAGSAVGGLFGHLAGNNIKHAGGSVTAGMVAGAAVNGYMSFLFAGLATENLQTRLAAAAIGAGITVGAMALGASSEEIK